MFLTSLFAPLARAALPAAGPSRAFSATATAQLLKTHKGAAKRFKKTATGMFKRGQCGKQHLNTGFSASRINRLQKAAYTTKTQDWGGAAEAEDCGNGDAEFCALLLSLLYQLFAVRAHVNTLIESWSLFMPALYSPRCAPHPHPAHAHPAI
ncbi:hypothetical protein Q8F55_006718 [Vanrija albida]|uniref:50S ribosomal protein L35 n=1 Tax=Vanrija albida TaxID=181172 RepID=A0ABR3PY96_9TREE